MIEEPPPLPFPSLKKLQVVAREVLDALRNPTSPTSIEYKFFNPPSACEPEKKKPRLQKKACENCKKKKTKCDNNATPDNLCQRQTCSCMYHVNPVNDEQDNTLNKNDKGKGPADASSFDRNPAAATPINIDIIPSTTVFRKPGTLLSGHYAGETSFCGYIQPELQPKAIKEECNFPTFDPTPIQAPYISESDQLYLIETYYENINPFFPILNKEVMKTQLKQVMNNRPTYLSPLFFYALFARAAHVETDRIHTQYNQQTFKDLGDACTTYVSSLVNCYKDTPRVSTVLALIIMANHLEQTKLPANLTKSWLWAGEAFRIALDLGIHRSLISEKEDALGQLCIRTFWLAYITDCTISMTYGRPSATEEKVLDVTAPKRIPSDDDCTTEWLDGLNSLISLSKIAARVIKFNYCPPPPFKIPGPVKRHNAFLASVDSWLTDIMHPHTEPDSPISSAANVIPPETTITRRMNFQKKMFLYTNLILLHRPYVNDSVVARNPSRPSYDICTFAAIIITDAAYRLEPSELIYHSKSPMIAYALVMALRIHIMNATTSPNSDKLSSDKNYYRSISTLEKLPQCRGSPSLLFDALVDLKEQYDNRFVLAQEREDEMRVAQNQIDQNTFATPLDPFGGNSLGKRKENSCTVSSDGNGNDLTVKEYIHGETVKSRKKAKPTRTLSTNSDTKKETKFMNRIVFSKDDASGSTSPKSKIEYALPKQEEPTPTLEVKQLQQDLLQTTDGQQPHDLISGMMNLAMPFSEPLLGYSTPFMDMDSSSTCTNDSIMNLIHQNYDTGTYEKNSQQELLSFGNLDFLNPLLNPLFSPDFLTPNELDNASGIANGTVNQSQEGERVYTISYDINSVSITPEDVNFMPPPADAPMAEHNFFTGFTEQSFH
ncbi:hypothetical protein INT47_008405 [Mucor saturninus]|uniref:Zn(2)-C6 fungal-type domain-containing protein n=1 Tax=Mucor saturninus TaxID=64648 RepID=A0A8H7QIB9_9FUNG|nr:hypothetical protein INT47_008405 [Mucor saturninus]